MRLNKYQCIQVVTHTDYDTDKKTKITYGCNIACNPVQIDNLTESEEELLEFVSDFETYGEEGIVFAEDYFNPSFNPSL